MKRLVALLFATAAFLLVMLSPLDKESLGFQNTTNTSIPASPAGPHRYRTVVILPVFTQAAYGSHGFYQFYRGRCSLKCLTVQIPKHFTPSYVAGGGLDGILLHQNATYVTDLDVDKDPGILGKYDRVILLHNEYVTQKEFDAIVHHPHVIYMYPNALYAKVKVDYDKNTITLVRGHGYPQKSIRNGFGWAYDNSKYEYNTACDNWHFYRIQNGYMLDCYPQLVVENDNLMLDEMLLL
ncbi:MAG: hypothetical protein KGH88_02515 [Thaumarchaeota archaeon]|nr:hypothetical protein [Nitrososphaerota archaeon]